MRFLFLLVPSLVSTVAAANPDVDRLISVTREAFPELPEVMVVSDIGSVCGMLAEGDAVYCTSEERIFLSQGAVDRPNAPYVVAHLYGHALQVTYGVADIALAAIQSDRNREAELRGMVTRQVECLAGLLVSRAGFAPMDLRGLFASEPFTGSHWGRNPVRQGPMVSIGFEARARSFESGQMAQNAQSCTVEEMSADLIYQADQSH